MWKPEIILSEKSVKGSIPKGAEIMLQLKHQQTFLSLISVLFAQYVLNNGVLGFMCSRHCFEFEYNVYLFRLYLLSFNQGFACHN